MNLKKVAHALGVSTATVSNAFNRPDQLSNKLRERILREAAELGYHGPNLAARTLRRGESDVIGIMLSSSLSYSLSDPVASQLLQGIAEVLAENNKQMLLLSSEVENAEQQGVESLPDGFILYGAIPEASLTRIKRLGKPVVMVDFDCDESSCVNIDNQKSARAIAELVLKSNQHQAAILGLKLVDSSRVSRLTDQDLAFSTPQIQHKRLFGYREAADKAGCAIAADAIWNIPSNTAADAQIAAREALQKHPRPDVLLCMSDVIALSAIQVADQLGLRVPEDVAITGFDGIPEGERSSPPLTTVCQRSIEKGKVAASMLLTGELNQKISLDTQIVERGSI